MVNPAGTTQTVQGIDIVKLGAYIADLLAGRQQSQSGISGFYDPASYPNQRTPTLERERYGASRADADRNYALDVQRFGLQVAQANYQNRISELGLQTQLQGPKDWLKYSYAERNLKAPENLPNVGGIGGAFQIPQLQMNTQPNDGTLTADQQRTATTNTLIGRANDFGRSNGGAVPATATANAAAVPPPPAGLNGFDQFNGSEPAVWGAGRASGATLAAPQGMTNASIPSLAFGGGSKPMRFYPQDLGDRSPNAGGSHAMGADFIPADADGGGSARVGSMHMAQVGDPQQPGVPNRELAMSKSPITVVPFDDLDEETKAMLMRHVQRMADGGTTDPYQVNGDTPFVSAVQKGAPAFGARGDALGAFGVKPFSYVNYQRALPSEQAMLQGYVDTPTDQGGQGGYFADELQRSKNAAFTGARDFPYRASAATGYGW